MFEKVRMTDYRCVVIDPPWSYNLRKKDDTHRNVTPYECMSAQEIINFPIPHYCDEKGCVLWLWTTNNHIIEAGRCIEAWGFTLKTVLTWEKVTKAGNPHMGVGHWLRNCTEHCFLATRGKVPSFKHSGLLTNEMTVLKARRRQHSRKPEEFYDLVEHFCPPTRLELFARQRREGWDCFGHEVDKF